MTYLGPDTMELPEVQGADGREPFTITPGMPDELKRRLLEKVQPGDEVEWDGSRYREVESCLADRETFGFAHGYYSLMALSKTDTVKVRPSNG